MFQAQEYAVVLIDNLYKIISLKYVIFIMWAYNQIHPPNRHSSSSLDSQLRLPELLAKINLVGLGSRSIQLQLLSECAAMFFVLQYYPINFLDLISIIFDSTAILTLVNKPN